MRGRSLLNAAGFCPNWGAASVSGLALSQVSPPSALIFRNTCQLDAGASDEEGASNTTYSRPLRVACEGRSRGAAIESASVMNGASRLHVFPSRE